MDWGIEERLPSPAETSRMSLAAAMDAMGKPEDTQPDGDREDPSGGAQASRPA